MIAPLIKDHIDAHLLPKNMIKEGYKYSRNDLRLRGEELLADYKCGFYSGTKCKGRMVAVVEEGEEGDENGRATKKIRIDLRQGHTCNKSLNVDLNVVSPVINQIINATAEMRTLISQKSLAVNKTSKEVCNEVHKLIAEKYKGLAYTGLTLNQMESAVFRERGKEYQNWEASIRSAPLVNFKDNTT